MKVLAKEGALQAHPSLNQDFDQVGGSVHVLTVFELLFPVVQTSILLI